MDNKNDNKPLLFASIIVSFLAVAATVYIVIINSEYLRGNSKNTSSDESNYVDGNSSSKVNNLNNYDIDEIENVVLHKSYDNNGGSNYFNTTITDKDTILKILSKIDKASDVGAMPNGVGLNGLDWFEINYPNDPSAYVYILDSGHLAINKSVGVGESGYGEYSIDNNRLTDLKNLIEIYSK